MALLRDLPLRRKLPLLVAGLTAGALIVGGTLAYVEVRGAALATAQARLGSIVSELEGLTAANQAVRGAVEQRIAASPLVRAALEGAPRDTARLLELLDSLRAPVEATLPVVILRRDGSTAFRTGAVGTEGGASDPDPLPPLEAERAYGPLRSVGGLTLYWLSLPVPGGAGEPLGWIGQRRRLGSPESGSTLALLLGSGIRLLLGTLTDSTWADPSGTLVTVTPSDLRFGEPYRSVTPGGEETLAFARTLSQLPWVVQVDIPMSQVMARPHAFRDRAILVGSILTMLVVLVAWLAARRLAQPLLALSTAADAISAGHYGRRVEAAGSDELGRLSGAFNTMAAYVEKSDEALRLQLDQAHTLAARLEEAMRAAERAREEAQRASRAKSEFLAHISHEIRTPISAVVAYIDLLKMGVPDAPTEQQRVYLQRIDGANQHLISLVNDLLDFASVESGQISMDPEVVSARESIASAVGALEAQAARKDVGLTSHCPEGLRFLGDKQRVQQIVLNLVSNAIKFTPRGGSVEVRGSRAEIAPPSEGHAAGAWVRIDVQDDGIGIAPDQMERIFEPFVHGPPASQEERAGTGLGLAISRRLASMMSGTLTVESVLGEGSTFTLWLPAAPAGESPPVSEQPPAAGEPQRPVLGVER